MRETEVASIFVGTLGSDGSIGGIVEKMLKTPAQRRQDQPPEVTMNGALYLIGWEAMRKHRKIYADPAASYGILMDRLHSIEIESAADLAYASYVVEHGMLDASPWRERGHDRTPRRIAVVTGSRADYGLLRGILTQTAGCRRCRSAASSPAACICCRSSARPGASSKPTDFRSLQKSTSSSTTTVPRRSRAAPASA